MTRFFIIAHFLCHCLPSAFGQLEGACTELATANSMAVGHNLSKKVAIVTGGDSGLGFAAAEALARQGATVVIAGHSKTKSEAAARNLTVATKADVRALQLDLSSFANIRAFAADFLNEFDAKLNFLINDAGISGSDPGFKDALTEDGFEEVFQVNYLGHFLLTELLLPALRNSSPSRVVHVASEAHTVACVMAGLPENCSRDFTYIPPPVVTNPNVSLYGFSKLMMIEHAAELTTREASSGVEAFSLCPGLVVTDMTKANPDFIKKTCEGGMAQKPCPYNPQEGAAVIAYTALDNAKPGLWYQRRKACSAGIVVTNGFMDSMRPELYRRSRQWVGLETPPESEQAKRSSNNLIV